MPIFPTSIKLTNGRSQQFRLLDANNHQVAAAATWTLSSATGNGSVAPTGEYTYIAPGTVQGVTDLVLTATTAAPGNSESATVQLVPPEVILTPAKVTLESGQVQQFQALVPGDHETNVAWNIAPGVGTMADGLYTAPTSLKSDAQVIITATSLVDQRKSATATISLVAEHPMILWSVGLFFYLSAVFCLVFLLTQLWPPNVTETTELTKATTARITAQSASARKKAAEDAAKAARDKAETEAKTAPADEVKKKALAERDSNLQKATADRGKADDDLKAATKREQDEEAKLRSWQDQKVWVPGEMVSRDVNLIWLVLVTGALGSFVYSARSFVSFVGNRTLRRSWCSWYLLYPPIGSALALIFYLVIRGGFLTATTNGSGVNLYGLVAISGLVGMFSKQATTKLDELFTTMFKTEKEDKGLKDKL